MKQLAPLKSVTDMGDCADAFVMLAKNGSITFHIFLHLTLIRKCYWSLIDNRCGSFTDGSQQMRVRLDAI